METEAQFHSWWLVEEAYSVGHTHPCWGCLSCADPNVAFIPTQWPHYCLRSHGLPCPMLDFHYQHGSHFPGLWMCLQCAICLLWWSRGKQREKEDWHWKIFLWQLSNFDSQVHPAWVPERRVPGPNCKEQLFVDHSEINSELTLEISGLRDPICALQLVESWGEPVISPL